MIKPKKIHSKLSDEARAIRRPPPPHSLIDALQDNVEIKRPTKARAARATKSIVKRDIQEFSVGDRVRWVEAGQTGVVKRQYADGYVSLILDGGQPAELDSESLIKVHIPHITKTKRRYGKEKEKQF